MGLGIKTDLHKDLKNAAGFTLLEVMLALVIISVGLMAMVQSAQTSAQTSSVLREKTAAYHVADQVMMQLYQKTDLQLGNHQGQQLFGGLDFYWQAELKTTDNIHINRIDLSVSLDRKFDYTEAKLTGFAKSQ